MVPRGDEGGAERWYQFPYGDVYSRQEFADVNLDVVGGRSEGSVARRHDGRIMSGMIDGYGDDRQICARR